MSDSPEIIHFEIKKIKTDEAATIKNIEWLLINFNNTGIYLIVALTSNELFSKHILGFFKRYYPMVARVYFNTGYIYHFLRRACEQNDNAGIRITKLVARKWIESEGAHKNIASSIDWTDISYKEAFSKLYDDDAWLKSIDFTLTIIKEDLRVESSGSISRDGLLICKENFKLFYYSIVHQVLEKASSDTSLFKGRSRKENPGLKVKPLIIDFGKEVFKDKKNNYKLINSLKKLKESSLSVYHGNPYLHASMIDYSDGSTYRIWVLSETSITIVPQMRASVASLERLFNHIGETFMEGEIKALEG